MAEITLTKNKIATIDEEFSHLKECRWYCNIMRYAVRQFNSGDGKQSTMFLHHAVIGFPLNGFVVDHIDNNPMNNRRSNLRLVSHRENLSNLKRKK